MRHLGKCFGTKFRFFFYKILTKEANFDLTSFKKIFFNIYIVVLLKST